MLEEDFFIGWQVDKEGLRVQVNRFCDFIATVPVKGMIISASSRVGILCFM